MAEGRLLTWQEHANTHGPWTLYICDKAGLPVEVIPDPSAVKFDLRHGEIPTGSVVLPANHPRVEQMMEPGARYRLVSNLTEEELSTGVLTDSEGEGSPDGTYGGQIGSGTWTMVDDYSILFSLLVAPTTGKTQATFKGPAESAARFFVTAAATRLGIPLTFAPSLGRGEVRDIRARWQPLSDVLLPEITTAGIGLKVRWDYINQRFNVEAYERQLWPRTITAHSGLVDDWSWSLTQPDATRAVVLGPGEGTARIVHLVIDTDLEDELGRIIEVAVDARDIDPVDTGAGRTLANVTADLEVRGQQRLAEGAPVVGLRVALAAVPEMAFGRADGLQVGDKLRVVLVPRKGVLFVTVTGMSLSWEAESGMTVTPIIGEWSESRNGAVIKHVRQLSVGYRKQRGTI